MNRRLMARRRQAGVTLVELMIAVAIVAILTAIAYPSYQRYVVRTHRTSASACLSQYAQFMERYYTANLTYIGAAPGNLPCSRENRLDERYTIAIRADSLTVRAYILDATPRGTQAALDTQCGRLTVDQTGARTVAGPAGRNECLR